MKHLALLLAGSALILACGEAMVDPALIPPTPPPPTFVIFGIVETEEGTRLAGATAELIRTGHFTLSSVTGDSGYFSFAGIRGPATVRVSKPGYTDEARYLNVDGSILSHFRLTRLLPDQVLTLGDTITATVQEGAPPCDPSGWDAEAPCRRFHFIAPASGQLLVAITWQGNPQLDAVLVTAGGGYVAFSDDAGFERALLEGTVVKDVVYELRVNSYYGRQDFKLTAELIQ